MGKKLIACLIFVLSVFFCTALAVAAAFLLFGTKTIYIADYMPPVSPSQPPFSAMVVLYLCLHLSILLIPITAIAFCTVFILVKTRALRFNKYKCLLALYWILPLIACAVKLVPQYGMTW